jgi:hypothetical protein
LELKNNCTVNTKNISIFQKIEKIHMVKNAVQIFVGFYRKKKSTYARVARWYRYLHTKNPNVGHGIDTVGAHILWPFGTLPGQTIQGH